jgi:hypothetical protein
MEKAKGTAAVAKKALDRLIGIAKDLPEAKWKVKTHYAQFLAKSKTFGWFLNNHRNDGLVSIYCKVFPGENAALIHSGPDRFYMPRYVGMHGWVAYRLDTPEVDWEEVAELVKTSYYLSAPPKLAALVRYSEEERL